jgi:dipeptide transport system substrate-binding protein
MAALDLESALTRALVTCRRFAARAVGGAPQIALSLSEQGFRFAKLEKRGRIPVSAKLAFAAALLVALASPSYSKTLVYCSEGDPDTLNPQLSESGTAIDAAHPIFDQLVQFEYGSTNIVPGLAERWEVTQDDTVFTFHLRKGVKFHESSGFRPTRDFNADDLLFSVERQWKEAHPYHRLPGSNFEYFKDMDLPRLLKSVEKIDDYTVRFTLTEPTAPFLADMAMDFMSIQSAEYGAAMLKANTPERVDREPIGTGPFQFASYQKDARIEYRFFPRYWRGASKVDRLVFSINKDPAVRWAKVKAGECQVMGNPNPADLKAMEADKDITLLHQEGLNVGYLALNTTHKPFDDVRVRRAIAMAVDKKAILAAVYREAGEAAKNPIPPTIWSYNKAIKDYGRDIAAAKKLIAEAGLTEGFTATLWAMPVTRPYNPNAKRIAELIQSDLGQLGIKAEIVTYEWGEYRKRAQAGEGDLVQLGWTGDNGDPDNFLFTLLSCASARPGGGNVAKWCDKDFDALVTKARQTTSKAERTKLYEQAQIIFHDQVPWVPIAHSVVYQPVSKKVVGFKIDPFGRNIFYPLDMK